MPPSSTRTSGSPAPASRPASRVERAQSLVVSQGAIVTTTNSTSNTFNQLTGSTRTGGGLPTLATTYVYDANGNLTTETAAAAITTYTWDADNRLRQVAQPGAVHQYQYDANGLRTKKVETGVETRFLLDGASVLAEFDSSNVATRRYLQNPESIDDIYEFSEGGPVKPKGHWGPAPVEVLAP